MDTTPTDASMDISPTGLKTRLDNGDTPALLDVREAFERRIADLPDHGQHRIPTGEILQRIGELDPERELVVYCRTGSRSEWAARVLRDRGFANVRNLTGGVMAWRDDVDPSLDAY